MGNAVTKNDKKSSKPYKPRKDSLKNYDKLLSKANKLKFHVSHVLTTKIKKPFYDNPSPQTGVHAHHHMQSHLEKHTNIINKDRSVVRADSMGEVGLAATLQKIDEASAEGDADDTTGNKTEGKNKITEEKQNDTPPVTPPAPQIEERSLADKTYDDDQFDYPWTDKQKFVLTDMSLLQDFELGDTDDATRKSNARLLDDKLQLCLICNFLLGKHCAEALNRKHQAMRSLMALSRSDEAQLLLHPRVLPMLFEVFRANLFYDEMVTNDEQSHSLSSMNLMDEFMPDPTKYYRKEWTDQLVVYKMAFELLANRAVLEPADAAAEALMSEQLLHGSTRKDTDIDPGKMSFVEGIISVILNQNNDYRERKFAAMILDRAITILNSPSATSRLPAPQQEQQTRALWRVLHMSLFDVEEPSDTHTCGVRGPCGIKEIIKIIDGLVGDNLENTFGDMLGESTDMLELDDFMGESTTANSREIDLSMLKITMHTITALHALSANYLSWYHDGLVMLAVKVALVDEDIAGGIISWLLRRWPWASQKKQIFFVHTLERVLDSVWYQEDVIKKLLPLMLRVLSRLLTAEHSLVMKQSLTLFLNEQISTTVWFTHLDKVLPALYPPLQHTAKTHWDTDSARIAESILTLLGNLDPDVFKEFQESVDKK